MSFWMITFIINLALFILLTSAVFTIAEEFKDLIKPRKIIPYSLIAVSCGVILDLVFVRIAHAAFQAECSTAHFYLMLANGGLLTQGLRLTIVPALLCFALLMLVQYFSIRWLFADRIGTRRGLWMSGLIAFLTHPAWVATFLILRSHA